MRKQLFRANEVPHMTKALRKPIMKRSEIESKNLKNKSYQNIKIVKSKNFYSKSHKKEKKFILKLIHVK